MQTYTCDMCGKEFQRWPSVANRNGKTGNYCSRKCSAQRQQHATHDITCPQCGKVFYRKPSERREKNYCSRICANQAQSKVLVHHPELRANTGVEIACKQCGKMFRIKPHRLGKTEFCSRKCVYTYRFGKPGPERKTRMIAGNRNPNFRGTNGHNVSRTNGRKYLGTKCMICGWDVDVDVHHIIPIRHGGTNNIDNLAVLCPNHHRMADTGKISQDELLNIVHSAIVQLSDHLPRFDPLQSHQPESDQQPPLFD